MEETPYKVEEVAEQQAAAEIAATEPETKPEPESEPHAETFSEPDGTQTELELEDGSNGDEVDEVIIAEAVTEPAAPGPGDSSDLKAVIEAAIYITDEPLSAEQIAAAVEQPLPRVKEILAQLVTEYGAPDRGLSIREVAGGYKMSTKPEHHEPIRRFVKKLQTPLKFSLASLETLAVIAYRQPITGPEIMDVRGVQGAGVLKTLLDRKLIAAAGRKNVLGKPMMYKTTREFLIQFGLNSLAELPTLKEFEELGRMAMADDVPDAAPGAEESLPASLPEGKAVAEPEPDPEPSALPATENESPEPNA